jgi:hypothetical protein
MKKILSLLFIILIAAASNAAAGKKSHLGQDIPNHVMLVSGFVDPAEAPCEGGSFENRAFFQVFPDGTKSESPFQLASGRLVITDVEWSVSGTVLGDPLPVGKSLRLQIFLGAGFEGGVFSSELTVDENSATGRPGKSEYATAGFVVGPGVTICPSAVATDIAGSILARIERVVLRGYVMED